MPKVYIDGIEYDARPGRNMLEVALDYKLNLPYFCWHPAMGSVGACRLCAVRVYKDEKDTRGKIQMACMTPANEGTRISMRDEEAAEFRRYVIEWLMVNHPHDCPVCDEGGECHLQDMTAMCGQVYRRYRFKKRTYINQYLGPFVHHEMNRCIQCYRCVRFYRDLAGGRDFNYFGSKNRVYFGREKDGVLQSEFSGNLVEVCPTGVFTDKTSAEHYTRKWDLQTAPSVCAHCGIGCNIIPGARYDSMRRVTARYNDKVNGYFLCDRGRYAYEFANSDARLSQCKINGSEANWSDALGATLNVIRDAKGVIGIGSPRASLESNFALKWLVGSRYFSTGLSAFEQEGAELALRILREGPARTPSLAEIENADVVLVLGCDPTNEAPMLDFAIRQAMRKAPLDIARKLKIPDWDANAVATALQGAKGQLHIATPWPIKLEEISAGVYHANPSELIKFAERIRNNLGVSGVGEDEITRAAFELANARQPLIVTSVSAGTEMIKAAARIAWALNEKGKDCWLFITAPEANTMGSAMLGGMSIDEALRRVESGSADTLLVLENDLSRRLKPAEFDALIGNVKHLIVLDSIETRTTSKAEVVIALPTYYEQDGTFINNEGRAQRFFQVKLPHGDVKPMWWNVREMAKTAPEWNGYQDVLLDLANLIPQLAPVLDAAPLADWRTHADQKVPRQSHRYSGRTAEHANVTIMEPQAPRDPDTPLIFSMEGAQDPVPGPLVPRFWWPGWNSEQAINKFQIEIGGPLHGENPGIRLIESSSIKPNWSIITSDPTSAFNAAAPDAMWVVPRPVIFGSEEMSRLAPAIRKLSPPAEVTMSPTLARKLGITEGKPVDLEVSGVTRRLLARFDPMMPDTVMSIPANLPETVGILAPTVSTTEGTK